MTRILLLIAALLSPVSALAQEEAEERSRFTRFVENQLSSENRQIRLNGIQGALSSEAVIGEITIADREGVWLRINNAEIEWTRTALLRGRLAIDRLAAESIEIARQPLPEEGAPPPEAGGGFSLPELPVSIELGELSVPRVYFGPTVFGLESELAVEGSMTLADGTLDASLDLERLDGPGGALSLDVAYSNASEELDLNLTVSEPEDGIIANALNIEDRPAIDLALTGSGPVGDLTSELTLDAGGERVLTGTAELDQTDDGLAIDTDVEGPIAELIAPAFRDFFGNNTVLSANALIRDGGGLSVSALTLESGAVSLDASLETTQDNFLRRLTLQATISDPAGQAVVLPVSGADTSLREASLSVDYGADSTDQWSGALQIAGLQTPTLAIATTNVDFGGRADNLDQPEERLVTFDVAGTATGFQTDDPAVAEALGEALDLDIEGNWQAGEPVELANATLAGAAYSLELAGLIEELVYDGTIAIRAEDLSAFAALAGNDLAGSVDLEADGTFAPVGGAFDLTFDGTGQNLQLGIDAADALLQSTVNISGGLARGENGFEARDFTIANDQLRLGADGTYASESADFAIELALSDLALVSDQISGPLTVTGTAVGENADIALDLTGEIPAGQLAGRSLRDVVFGFTGDVVGIDPQTGATYGDGVDGALNLSAFLDGEAIALDAGIRATSSERRLSDLSFRAGGATVTGDLAQSDDGLLIGEIELDAPSIETLGALAMQEATGAVSAAISLSAENETQRASLSADVRSLAVAGAEIGSADIAADIVDLFGVPKVQGRIEGSDIVAGGTTVETLLATAERDENETAFDADITIAGGTTIQTAGLLEERENGLRVRLEELELMQGATQANLAGPATILIEGETITLDQLVLSVDGGEIRASGTAAETLDLDLAITALPLDIANTVMPDLDAAGTVDATASVTGSRDDPAIDFEVRGEGLTAAPLAETGLPPLDIAATGQSAGGRVNLDATLTGAGGISADVSGSVPMGDGQLDLTARVNQFPVASVDALAGNRGLAGRITAEADIGGTIASPDVVFNLSGDGLSADQLRDLGIQPLSIAADGRFVDNVVNLQSASVDNAQGISVDASGSVRLAEQSLNLSVQGNVPLSLANSQLAERGTRVSGAVEFSVGIQGPFSDPRFNGMVSANNAGVIDPGANVQLEDITLLASVSGQQITINTLSAGLSTGGTISAGGTISLDAAANFPANISITLDETRYADGDFLIVTASGNLSVSGPLARDPVISGVVNVDRAEIGIPEGGAAIADVEAVRHIAPPADVARTLARAGVNQQEGDVPVPTARPSIVQLDITVNAPQEVFVRGRGLDAELGGSLTIQGPASNVEPVGAFELIRGRLSILGRRITFESGSVTLIGDLDPFVNLVATVPSGDTLVTISVSGRASDISIDFSSQPELPQDEVIARLIFDRGISELSAFQIAQLAAAVAELTGGQNTSLVGQLRQSTGLDDLDVVTDSDGNAAVRAGRYLRDNIYLGVQAGAGDSSEVTIDLDITENLKARGSAGAGGNTGVGLFYERDY